MLFNACQLEEDMIGSFTMGNLEKIDPFDTPMDNEEILKPGPGMVAICAHGYVGLIQKDCSVRIGRSEKFASKWEGIHLQGDKLGQSWESSCPKVLGHFSKFFKLDR